MSQDAEKSSLQFENQVIFINENYNMTYFSKSSHEIPRHFPDICPFSEFPWHFFKFTDNSLTLKKYFFPDISLTRGNPDYVFLLRIPW